MKFFRYAQKDRGKLKMVILFLIENVTRTFLVIARHEAIETIKTPSVEKPTLLFNEE